MADISFEIIKTLGIISEEGEKWRKELNLIRWNDNVARYDLRSWNATHEKMSKGITLSQYELRQLKELLNSIDL